MNSRKGFTLVEIIIVMGILSLLAGVVLPNFLKARDRAGTNVCISNLRKMDEAKSMWAMWEGGTGTDVPGWGDLVPDYLKETPTCPQNGTYSIEAVSDVPTCSEPGHVLAI